MTFFIFVFSCLFGVLEAASHVSAVDVRGSFLALDDGTIWEVDWWNSWSAYRWEKGQKVDVSCREGKCQLFNLDLLGSGMLVVAQRCHLPETPRYRHFVSEIVAGEDAIRLQNGSLWKRERSYFDENRPLEDTWKPNDEVSLRWIEVGANGTRRIFFLHNLRTLEEVLVAYQPSGNLSVELVIEEIGSSYITLSDGSHWEKSIFDFVAWWGWKKGDLVMVYKRLGTDPSTYSLVNSTIADPDYAILCGNNTAH